MVRRFAAAALALSLSAAGSLAQQPPSPLPLFPTPPPESFRSQPPPSPFREEPLPPIVPAPEMPRAFDPRAYDQRSPEQIPPGYAPRADIAPPAVSSPATTPDATRVFCDQPVTVRVAERDRVPERYRGFVGMWSDAAWTPQMCAALIVEDVAPDGTARIAYAFGPIGSNPRAPGGVLHGTGIIRGGELRFQNSDGSQFAFRPIYSDLDGRLTTPQGQTHQTIFKKTF